MSRNFKGDESKRFAAFFMFRAKYGYLPEQFTPQGLLYRVYTAGLLPDHGQELIFVDDRDAERGCLLAFGGTHVVAGQNVVGFL